MKELGTRIRVFRKERKLTLVEVARRTGIDQATLSRIENGVMTGTVQSHMKIAEVLGLRLPDLYESALEKQGEKEDRAVREKIDTFSHSGGAVAELLTTGILQKKMMPIILKLKPGGRTEIEEYPAGAERFIYMLKGDLEIKTGKDSRVLKPGDSLYFNASGAHHFENPGKTECSALSVLTPAIL